MRRMFIRMLQARMNIHTPVTLIITAIRTTPDFTILTTPRGSWVGSKALLRTLTHPLTKSMPRWNRTPAESGH